MKKLLFSLCALVQLTCIFAATSFGGSFTVSGDRLYFPDGTFFTSAPKDGKSILNGNGAPVVTGNIGDFYLDTHNSRLYGPYNGSWGAGVSLVGPQGATGAPGANGYNSLVRLVYEPAGGNCSNGGVAVQVGLDQNRNGILDPGEASPSNYYCFPNPINMALVGTYVGTATKTSIPTPQTAAQIQYSINSSGVLSGTLVDIMDNNRTYTILGTVNMVTGALYFVNGMYDGSVVSVSGTPTGGVWTVNGTASSEASTGTYTTVKQ